MQNILIGFSNWLTRIRSGRVEPAELLLLVPHCLQLSLCARNVVHDIDECRRCGQCNVTDLLRLRDEFGVQCNLASGGRQAVSLVKDASVRAVVAVACERELIAGIMAAFPKPILAVPNLRPKGPCKDTRVDIDGVRDALAHFLGPASGAVKEA